MDLNDIYNELHCRGLCKNQIDFSINWLGRSSGYFAWMRSTQVKCCNVSLQLLAERLQKISDHLRNPLPTEADIRTIIALRSLREDALMLAKLDHAGRPLAASPQ
ncbi:DUF6626 family protein [Polymorphobacter arshaanensis]|uniref:DUF6626 family protein n=1 Tax=Glacieibacterium arshaanense TaxID=2511025 RepID=UPI003C720ABD